MQGLPTGMEPGVQPWLSQWGCRKQLLPELSQPCPPTPPPSHLSPEDIRVLGSGGPGSVHSWLCHRPLRLAEAPTCARPGITVHCRPNPLHQPLPPHPCLLPPLLIGRGRGQREGLGETIAVLGLEPSLERGSLPCPLLLSAAARGPSSPGRPGWSPCPGAPRGFALEPLGCVFPCGLAARLLPAVYF